MEAKVTVTRRVGTHTDAMGVLRHVFGFASSDASTANFDIAVDAEMADELEVGAEYRVSFEKITDAPENVSAGLVAPAPGVSLNTTTGLMEKPPGAPEDAVEAGTVQPVDQPAPVEPGEADQPTTLAEPAAAVDAPDTAKEGSVLSPQAPVSPDAPVEGK